jgi:hypothetical protein
MVTMNTACVQSARFTLEQAAAGLLAVTALLSLLVAAVAMQRSHDQRAQQHKSQALVEQLYL